MDAFAVSVGISLAPERISEKRTFRMALHFGFFQFAMALLGWVAVQSILIKYIEPFDHWAAFGLLLTIGGKMIYESFRQGKKYKKSNADPTRGLFLVMLSVATSIDALAAGMSLAAVHVDILYPAVVIGLVAFLMTVFGVKIGPLFGQVVGRRSELLGGLILIVIGVKILSDSL